MASKSPAQIVAAAQASLRAANGFVAAGTLRQAGHAVQLQIVYGGPSRFRLRFGQSGKSFEVIALRSAGYVRGSRGFWIGQAGVGAARLANRWIELSTSASQRLTSGFGAFTPRRLARCLGEDLGSLSRGPGTEIDGRSAVTVRQAGNLPGSNPGTIAVATTGPAYPLRIATTGPTRSGGKVDACNDGKGSNLEGTLTLSDFDRAPAVAAPKHSLKAGGTSSHPSV